jgi:hypothetical protein
VILVLGDDRRCAADVRLSSTCYLTVADPTGEPHNVRGASVGSRRGSASEFGDVAKLTGKRNDKAGFVTCMFPYKHDRNEYIMGFRG